MRSSLLSQLSWSPLWSRPAWRRKDRMFSWGRCFMQMQQKAHKILSTETLLTFLMYFLLGHFLDWLIVASLASGSKRQVPHFSVLVQLFRFRIRAWLVYITVGSQTIRTRSKRPRWANSIILRTAQGSIRSHNSLSGLVPTGVGWSPSILLRRCPHGNRADAHRLRGVFGLVLWRSNFDAHCTTSKHSTRNTKGGGN